MKPIAMVSGIGMQRTERRDLRRGQDLRGTPVRNKALPDPSAFMIKTFGSTIRALTFNRLPTVIQKAKAAIPEDSKAHNGAGEVIRQARKYSHRATSRRP